MSEPKKKATLKQIYEAHERLNALLLDSDYDPVQQKEYDGYAEMLGGLEQEKIDNIAAFLRHLDDDAAFLKQEAARLAAKAEVLETRKANFLNYLLNTLNNFGKDEVNGRFSKISKRTSRAVRIILLGALPEKFVKKETIETPDKKAIKKALEEGKLVPGAELEHREYIRVR